VKEKSNDVETQNTVPKIFENISFVLYRDKKFSWGKIPYTECCARGDGNGTVLLIRGVRKLRGVRYQMDNRRW
jgi:hypothetical protein